MDRPDVCDDDDLAALYLDLTTQALQNGPQDDDIEPWIAQELAKRVEDYEIIRYRLLGQAPEAYAYTLLPAPRAHVYRLLDAIRQLPEVRAARQERFGYDATGDEKWMDDDERAMVFGDVGGGGGRDTPDVSSSFPVPRSRRPPLDCQTN